jgi:hypothetical protein
MAMVGATSREWAPDDSGKPLLERVWGASRRRAFSPPGWCGVGVGGEEPELVVRGGVEGRTPGPGDGLHVEDLFNAVGELEGRDGGGGGDVDDADAALELFVVCRDRRVAEGGGFSDP